MSDKQKSHKSTINSPSIPPGYKQTAVGVIPGDWEVKTLHEIAIIKTGPFGTLLKASEYSDSDGVPLISVGEIREGFLRITDDTPYVPKAVIRRLPQYVLKKGDIVFGRKGGVERSALIRQQQDGWFLGSDGISVHPTKDCHEEYIAFQFQSTRVQGWLIQNAIGTTMASLNQGILRKVIVPLPSTKAEQKAIAEALSDADAFIESLEQLIAKKRHIKQGAMQELLTGKKRLPGFSGEWTDKPFSEICWFQEGPGVRDYQFTTSGIKLLNGTNIFRGELNLDSTSRFISEKEAYSAGMNILLERQAPAWHWECQAPAWRIWNAKQQLRDSGVVVLAKLELGDPAWRSGLAFRFGAPVIR